MVIRKIFRDLIDERKPELKDIPVTKYFTDDNIIKTIKLMGKYNFNTGGGFGGLQYLEVIEVFLEKLEFEIPSNIKLDKYDLSPLFDYIYKENVLLGIVVERQLNFNCFSDFMKDFNNFYDKNSISFKLHFDDKNLKCLVLKKENKIEEINKDEIFELLNENKYESVNTYFTNALKDYTKGDYKDSIENSYLALEKLLKILTNNHSKDANSSFKEFQNANADKFKGIFSVRKGELKNKIAFVETIRSEVKSHSPKEQFNTDEFLNETARYQINEIMNLILILFSFIK